MVYAEKEDWTKSGVRIIEAKCQPFRPIPAITGLQSRQGCSLSSIICNKIIQRSKFILMQLMYTNTCIRILDVYECLCSNKGLRRVTGTN